MSDICSKCGKNFSGMFSVKRVCESTVADFANYGINVQDICTNCCNALKEQVIEKRKSDIKNGKQLFEDLIRATIRNIEIYTTPHDHKYDSGIKGIVSGYSVIGTGLLTEISSAWTDFLGIESNPYHEKIRIAEKKAIDMAKLQAAELGATSISGVRLSLSEATSGNGMLMFSCIGTALRIEKLAEPIDNYLDQKEKIKSTENIPLIVITHAEENYQKLRDIEKAVNENSK